MPNAKVIMAIAEAAESAAVKTMPGLSEKVALSLPEIFGPAGKHSAAKVFEAAPADGALLDRVATQFQEKLAAFGLPHSAKPSELYKAAESSGIKSDFLMQHKGRHVAGSGDLVLGDGSVLTRLAGAGRSGRTETTIFRSADRSAGITENYSSFFGSARKDIGFYTPNVRVETALGR